MLGWTFSRRVDGPRTRGGLFLSTERPAARRDRASCLGGRGRESVQPCLRTTLSASSRSGKPNGSGTRRSARSTSIPPGPSSTSSTCSPIPAAPACTSAIPRATPPPTSSAATSGCAATTSCTRWAGTPSACPPSSTPSRPTRIPRITTQANIDTFRRQIKSLGFSLRLGPRGRYDRSRITTSGRSGSSCKIYDTWYDPDFEWTDRQGRRRKGKGRPIAELPIPPATERSRRLSRCAAARLPGGGARQLVPGAGDRAGQRGSRSTARASAAAIRSCACR